MTHYGPMPVRPWKFAKKDEGKVPRAKGVKNLAITDEELREVKRQARGKYRHAVGPQILEAVLRRSEAAEALIEYTHHDEVCPKTFFAIPEKDRKPCSCGLDEKYAAWRKSKGE